MRLHLLGPHLKVGGSGCVGLGDVLLCPSEVTDLI